VDATYEDAAPGFLANPEWLRKTKKPFNPFRPDFREAFAAVGEDASVTEPNLSAGFSRGPLGLVSGFVAFSVLDVGRLEPFFSRLVQDTWAQGFPGP